MGLARINSATTVERLSEKELRHAKPSPSKAWLKAIELTAGIEASPHRIFADLVEEQSRRAPDQPALISDVETLSYRALTERINRYARWALGAGIQAGDTVCLLMPSRPEYIAAWLGITKVGGVVALINTRLVGASLAHCIGIAKAKHVIVTAELSSAFDEIAAGLALAPQIWIHGGDVDDLGFALDRLDGGALSPAERREVTINDPALLIYTSGTTGLPKAARVSHRRIMNWSLWFAGLTGATVDDRMYDCLPLHHSVGGIVAPCSMLAAGASVVLAEKFSVRDFWRDIVRWDCTLFQYIGELCRYLVNAPQSEAEADHRLRLACGNGLRGDIWDRFQARFSIPQILEFYAATEGNFSLFNVEGKAGAIGRVPPFLAHRFPVALVRYNADSGAPLRSADGLCIACARGESGEALGRIGTAAEGGGRFEGYSDPADTEKKVLRNVFAPGDAWFRTGDLMSMDKAGYFHFVDRIGDTFRWKGENVSASEVEAAISSAKGVAEVSVYGVTVPGADGRAGMASIVAGAEFEFADLQEHLATRLPAYALPVFIRISAALDITETFKQKKQDLVRQGFDLLASSDPVFVRDALSGDYVRIDVDVHARILVGALRL